MSKDHRVTCNLPQKKCNDFQFHWKKYVEENISDVIDRRYLFRIINHLYNQIYGICQNIGIAINDYSKLLVTIRANISIKEENFRPPYVQDPELQVSERVSQINQEAKDCLLLVNPSKSMLGHSAVRIAYESCIIIKIGEKIRQSINAEKGTRDIEVRFTSKMESGDVFYLIKELFPKQKEYEAFREIYAMSSKTIHRAIPQPNYISWGSLLFGMDELEKMINALKPDDPKLKELITELADKEKICFFPLYSTYR